jgi:LacI family transcriptional regulator
VDEVRPERGDQERASTAGSTIYAVAERAGVSIATVSRVLSDSPKASPTAREKVLEAVAALHYVPRGAARSLAARREASLGLVIGDSTGPYHPQLALGFQAAAAATGCTVLLAVVDDHDPEGAVRRLLPRVDGLAVAPSSLPASALDALARSTPVVLLGREPHPGCDAVVSDSTASAVELVAHLAAHDRRRLRFVGDPGSSYDAGQRHRGYLSGCAAADLDPGEPLECQLTEAAGERVARRLLDDGPLPDALVCVNDEVALALGATLADAGVVVGRDVALTGWDDVPAARWVRPSLTTVAQPVREVGALGGQLLAERAGARGPRRPAPAVRTLPTSVMIRSSCGCAPAGRSPT